MNLRCPLSEGPYVLTVKTVTPEKVVYKKELWFTSPDVSIADAEFTYEITYLGGAYGHAGYYFLEIVSLTLINNGDLPAKRDTDARALITLDGKPENMTLLTRPYSISPYKIGFYPPHLYSQWEEQGTCKGGSNVWIEKRTVFCDNNDTSNGRRDCKLQKSFNHRIILLESDDLKWVIVGKKLRPPPLNRGFLFQLRAL